MPDPRWSRDPALHAVLGAAKAMPGLGLAPGTSGNVSARLADGHIVITPASMPYRDMTAADLAVLTREGEQVAGARAPSSERLLHLACYAAFAEVGAVLHSHPEYATMFACARQPVPPVLDEAAAFIGGEVPVAAYAMSGTAEVGTNAVAVLGQAGSALLASHGLVTVAATPAQALNQACVAEHCARVAWGVRALGGYVPLPPEALDAFTRAYRAGRNAPG
jgi:L-fuculose-phosphate aldolase